MSSGRRGSVRQADNGTWWFIVDVPGTELDARGRPKRRQTRRRDFRTRREAVAEMNKILGSLDENRYVEPTKLTLGAFLTDVWLPAIKTNLEPSTWESYERIVRLHCRRYPLAARLLRAVTPADLNAHYAAMLTGEGSKSATPLSATTVRHLRTTLNRAYRDAVRWKYADYNPVRDSEPPKKAPRLDYKIWTPAQVGRFLEVASDHQLAPAWWLLATGGLRRGEALGARWSDVDLEKGTLRIRQTVLQSDKYPYMRIGSTKTEQSRRTVYLDADTVSFLKTWKARQAEQRLALGAGYDDHDLIACMVHGSPQNPGRVSEMFQRLRARAGLPEIRLHDLRHTHATHLIEAGVNMKTVSERLGHSGITITMDTYSHLSPETHQDAARIAADLRKRKAD